jgi:hypothetical protein
MSRPTAAASGPGCAREDLNRAGTESEAARQALLALPIDPTGDRMPTTVSPEWQKTIAAFKDKLTDYVTQQLSCTGADSTPARIQKQLLGAARRPAKGDGRYGASLDFEARRPAAPSGLMAIVARFQIECGEDAVLLVFAREDRGWRLILRSQAPPYEEIGDAFGRFDYAISPDASGGWYALTKSVSTQCFSNWSAIRYAVLRPAPGRTDPVAVFKASDGIYSGDDDFGVLEAHPRVFEVRFSGVSVDPSVHSRLFVRRFSLNGAAVRRVPPLALSPQDFVDEWIVSPWSEAAGWSAPEVRGQKSLHDSLSGNHEGYLEFESTSLCPTVHRVQVELELWIDDAHRTRFYFQVPDRVGDFRMLAVSTEPSSACPIESSPPPD